MVSYNPSIYAPFQTIGGKGGNEFVFYGGTNGALLQKIGVWVGGWQLRGIRAWLTNGQSATFGTPQGDYKEFTFQPGETITRLSLWGNGAGTRTGWLEFSTSLGKSFSHGMNDWKRKQEYPIDIGSGICCGIFGGAGDDIDRLGFAFLRPIRSSRLTNLSYPTLGLAQTTTRPEVLDSIYYDNSKSSIAQTYRMSSTKSVERTSSWSVTAGLEYSLTTKVEGSVPELVTVGAESTWKVSISGTYGRSTTKTDSKTWDFEIVCPPRSIVKAEATIRQAEISLPYSATLEVELDTGGRFSYPVQGTYEGITFTDVNVMAEEVQPSTLPARLAIGGSAIALPRKFQELQRQAAEAAVDQAAVAAAVEPASSGVIVRRIQ